MSDEIAKLLAGSLGYFWRQDDIDAIDLSDERIAGILQQRADGSVELAGLVADPAIDFWDDSSSRRHPAYIVGSTDAGGVLLSGAVETRSSVVMGGSQASTVHFDCESVVSKVPLHALRAGTIEEVSANWLGIGRWAGIQTTTETVERDDAGRVKNVLVGLSKVSSDSITLSGDETELQLGSTWTVLGARDSRLISAPLSFTITPPNPARIEAVAHTLTKVQDLLCIAFQGFVGAESASVILHDPDEGRLNERDMWNVRLMRVPARVEPPKSMTESPLFYLADIGGLEGLKRWIELYESHPRLMRPATTLYRIGPTYAESQLIDIGTAIDYWRGANKGVLAWANEKFQPLAVANSLGQPFTDWVGDKEKWANHFWYHYNGLKHFIPGYRFDRLAVNRLASSGMMLLQCATLRAAAGRADQATNRALSGHRWHNRGVAVREWLESVGADPSK